MTIYIAHKTLGAINAAIAQDHGNAFRRMEKTVLPWMVDAYRDDEDNRRSHLGASIIGDECERRVFYRWRWALNPAPTGYKGEEKIAAHARMLRLWNRGHLEEGRFIAMLLLIGVKVYTHDPATGKQYQFRDGHFGGSCDGVLLGLPDLPEGMPALGEFKTHGAKSFTSLLNDGVQIAHPEHFVQMQTYMHVWRLPVALYLAVEKDTDELHAELIGYDARVATAAFDLAQRIIQRKDAPPKIRYASPGYHTCKMCNMKDVCFRAVPADRNCRTCEHVEFLPSGQTMCTLHRCELDKAAQIAACPNYTIAQTLK